jgi:predicted DNA-binding protein YlxM (UPF0122 family)
MSKNLEICLLLDFYGNWLTDKQYEVMDFYYNEDLSLAEISEHTHITRQGVRDSIKRGEAILIEAEEKLGFVKRFSAVRKKVDEILQSVSKLECISEDVGFPEEVDEDIQRIKCAAEGILE